MWVFVSVRGLFLVRAHAFLVQGVQTLESRLHASLHEHLFRICRTCPLPKRQPRRCTPDSLPSPEPFFCFPLSPQAHEHFRSLAHTQSAEKTMASAVKDLSAAKRDTPTKNNLFDDAHLHTPLDHPTDIEPPVVTRALMRARKVRRR